MGSRCSPSQNGHLGVLGGFRHGIRVTWGLLRASVGGYLFFLLLWTDMSLVYGVLFPLDEVLDE